ncbi:Pr gag-pro-pol, partial [Chelydra serpentina]
VAAALKQTAAAWGTPTEVQADGGPPFPSKSIERLIFGWGASLHIHTKYHPQSNGVVERKIAVLKTMLRTANPNPDFKNWSSFLPQVLIALNKSYSRWPHLVPTPRPPWSPVFSPGQQVWLTEPQASGLREPVEATILRAGKYPNTYLVALATPGNTPGNKLVHHNWLSKRS